MTRFFLNLILWATCRNTGLQNCVLAIPTNFKSHYYFISKLQKHPTEAKPGKPGFVIMISGTSRR